MAKFNRSGFIKAEDAQHTGAEPKWEGNLSALTKEEISSKVRDAFQFYTYYCDSKDCAKFIAEWMKTVDYSKADIALIKKYGHKTTTQTMGKIARMLSLGAGKSQIFNDSYLIRLKNDIAGGLAQARELARKEKPVKKEDKPAVKKKTPMELLEERISEEVLADLEGKLDDWVAGGRIIAPDMYSTLGQHTVPANGVKFVKAWIKSYLTEFKAVAKGNDEQLNEGYAYLGKRKLNSLIREFDKMLKASEKYELDKKSTRPKKAKKPVAAQKQVKSVKYLEKCEEFNVQSIDPVNIIGAQTVYLFNAKYKSVTVLKAQGRNGFTVKGMAIKDFDTEKSFDQKLRKPQEFVNLFKKGTAPKKIDAELDSLTTKRTETKGRLNANYVILKTFQ